jgi:competence CoiA-like predicted nuclease
MESTKAVLESAKAELEKAMSGAVDGEEQDETTSRRKLELEDKILRYFQNKEIERERKEENKLLFEEIQQFYAELETDEDLVLQLPNGEYAVLAKKAYVKEVFDKDALAQELMIAKDELKTPFDYSILTSQGKLTPDMIAKHTQTETVVKVRLSKRKTKPRAKKK